MTCLAQYVHMIQPYSRKKRLNCIKAIIYSAIKELDNQYASWNKKAKAYVGHSPRVDTESNKQQLAKKILKSFLSKHCNHRNPVKCHYRNHIGSVLRVFEVTSTVLGKSRCLYLEINYFATREFAWSCADHKWWLRRRRGAVRGAGSIAR